GVQGTFKETAGSGSIEFTDADNNTIWNISPQKTLAVNEQLTLLYKATFNNTILGLPVGSQVRAEAIVTFGNSGTRGGGDASANDIDIDGDGCTDSSTASVCGNADGDEHNVRSVPCRVTTNVPTLIAGNAQVTLTDTSSDVTLSAGATNVSLGNFQTNIGGGTGSESISSSVTRNVSIGET